MLQKILIIGGTGKLGEPVARRMQAEGFAVRIFTRRPEQAAERFPAPFEIAGGDVEDRYALANAMEGCQVAHINLHGQADPDLERRGALAVAQAARKAGLERIGYLSGASVCAENAWFADTQARVQAEEAIIDSGVAYTIFRADFFMETLPNFVRGKMLLQIGKHPHPYRWVAAQDYAGMVARAYTNPQAAGKILYVGGPQAMTMREALLAIKKQALPDYRLMYLPIPLARLMALAGKRSELKEVLPFFAYCEKVQVFASGSTGEANALLGAAKTTVEQWVKENIQRHAEFRGG